MRWVCLWWYVSDLSCVPWVVIAVEVFAMARAWTVKRWKWICDLLRRCLRR